ncbi:four-helix bundle copper-binding protein, partial [Streptomyces sp. NPDC002172]
MTQTGPMTAMSKQMQECVNTCMATHTMCEETLSSCMSMEGGQAHMRIMRALMDCSEATRMCADMMMRRSPLSPEMCAMCAKACDMCADRRGGRPRRAGRRRSAPLAGWRSLRDMAREWE